jgi:hypothetical protein
MSGTGRFGQSIYGLIGGAAIVLGSTLVALIGLELGLRIWDGQPLVPTTN